MKIGIDRIGAYVPSEVLRAEVLAEARDIPLGKLKDGLGVHAMAVVPPWEDTVSLAANAGLRALGDDVAAEEIGLCIVGTESGVDHSKPTAIFVRELLGLPSNCRTYEVKHACVGGTAALLTAMDWIASGSARGRKALVIASDIAKYPPGSAGEPTQGAGAVALVVSENPALVEMDRSTTGVFAGQVHDFWRPLDQTQAIVDGKYSVDCYLEALEHAFADYARQQESDDNGEPLSDRFARLIFHAPFPRMASKAHTRMVVDDWQSNSARSAQLPEDLTELVENDAGERVDPTLWATRLIGNTYTASMYFGLAAILEREAAELEGKTLGFFSYGSGCCSEFFAGQIVEGASRVAEKIGLGELLERRKEVSMAEYERHHAKSDLRATENPEKPGSHFAGPIYFAGTIDEKRTYASHGRGASVAR
jgi:hydroxymethylglutaryl-CoA synthase